jgi:hypothetical protein
MSHSTNADHMAALLHELRRAEAAAYNALLRTYDQQLAVAARTEPASGDPNHEALWTMTLCRNAELFAARAETHANDAFWLTVDLEALERRTAAGDESVSPHDIDRAGELAKDAQAYARTAKRIAEDMRHWADVRVGVLAGMCDSTGAALWAKLSPLLPITA